MSIRGARVAPVVSSAVEDVYIRAAERLDHPQRRRIGLQCQLGNLRWRDFHPLDHQLAALDYPAPLLISQSQDGISFGCAARRNIAGDHCNRD